MRQRLVNLEATIASLKPFLEQYLKEHGIDTSNNFRCLNPKHEDSSPSMTCKQVPEQAFCFGCSYTADIFIAAHHLEGKPLAGKEFVEQNVLYLAKKYEVDIPMEDLTPEEIYEYRTYSAYNFAAKLISDTTFGDYSKIDEEIARRGWSKDKCANWGIGTVNYEEFRERMKKAGYEQKFLQGVDLDRSNLFNNNNLIFTVNDDKGRPVGFSAKNLRYRKDDNSYGPKYLNTRGTELECAIFKKGERLYGFDIAKEIQLPLYIFEGQADVITARHFGIMNCCCTLGTALTDHHITLLKKYGIFNIVMVFDGDAPGELAVQKVLDDKFGKEKDFRVRLCQLPGGMDPDELLRSKGADEFVRLKKWSAFEWRLMRFMEAAKDQEDLTDDYKREIAEKMTPIILAEKSHIRQEEMAKQVGRMTGYDYRTIISEIKRLRDEKEAEVQARKRNAIEAFMSEVRHNPDEAEVALVQAQAALSDINKSIITNVNGSMVNFILSQKEEDDKKNGEFSGFWMKSHGLWGLAKRMDDNWRKDSLVFIGGVEQSGKSSLAAQMAWEIATDERNNAIVIYHSIDDAARFILYKLICNASDSLDLYLNHVSNPNYWKIQPGFEYVENLRNQAYQRVIQTAQEEKIIIKDSSDGQSIFYAEGLVKFFREKYPEKNIVLMIDNFHKLPDYGELKGPERAKRLSNQLKNLAVKHRCTVVATVEYRKLEPGEKPTNLAIAECLEENTIIRDAVTGERIKIKDINPGTIVHTINEDTLKIVNQRVLNKVFKGEQECYKINLSNGMYIEATENHPLYRDYDGWQKISNLKVGDYIATAQNSNITNPIDGLDKDLARFLGYLAGDGNYGTERENLPATPRFSNKNIEIAEDAMDIAIRKFENIKTPYDMHLGSKEIRFSQISHKGNSTNPIKIWLKDHIGIWNQIGTEKRIPEIIFSSSDEAKANYLVGLFSTDGSVADNLTEGKKKKRGVRLFNISKYLIFGAQSLLLDLGINSTISGSKKKKKEKHKYMYTLSVSMCSVEKFRTLLSLTGPKNDKLLNMDIPKRYTLRQDNLPMAFSHKLNKFLVKTGHTVWFDLETSRYAVYKNKRIGRRIYEEMKDKLPSLPNDISKLASEDIIWQKITSIIPIGKRKVYDLEIEGTHNFLANNIFCHNSRSLAYDASVIIHLYNELHHKSEDEAVLVHYDKNGIALPRIWCKFGKNKVSGYEGREFLDLYGAAGQMRYVDLEQAIHEQKERMLLVEENKKTIQF